MSKTRFSRPSAALLIAGSLLVCAPPALGQAGDNARAAPQQNPSHIEYRDATVSPDAMVSLDFAGGTLEEYVTALKRAMQPSASNILVRGDAAAVPVGPVELEDVPLWAALRLVFGDHEVGQGRGFVNVETHEGGQGRPAYSIEVQIRSPDRGDAGRQEVLVLSLKEITTPLPGDPPEVVVPAETVLTAIETALAVAEDQTDGARVRYHAESGLLVMAGDKRALVAADQVIDAIQHDVRERRDRARDLQRAQGLTNPDVLEEQLADARAEAEMAEIRMRTAEQHLEIAAQQANEMQALVDAGAASPDELRGLRMRESETEAQTQQQRILVQRAVQRVQQFEKSLQRSIQIVAGGGADNEAQALREENMMLRARLAALEAQLAKMSEDLNGRNPGGDRGGRDR